MDINNINAIITNNDNINNKKKMITPVTFKKDSPYYKEKSPDEKEYLVFYYAYDDNGEEYKSFELITGRKEVYEWIKSNIDYINIDDSRILVEGVKLEGSASVYEFLVYAKTFYFNDGFDIDEYMNKKSEDDEEYDNHINLPINSIEAYDLYNKVSKDIIDENKNIGELFVLEDDDDNYV